MSDYLTTRRGYYYYFRRIPAHIAAFDGRGHIRVSLKTKDEREARKRAAIYNEQIEAFWRGLATKGKRYDDGEYRQAIATARLHGFTYQPISEVLKEPLVDVVERVVLAADRDPATARALLGTARHARLPLSSVAERYWPLCGDRVVGKTENQMRKWKVPRAAALENFIRLVGDKSVEQVTRRDVLDFRGWWMKRISEDGLNADTANKQLARVKDMLSTVALSEGLVIDFESMFTRTALRLKKNSRPPYEAAYVQKTLLSSGALEGLNEDARYLVYAMADTGARESELIALRPEDIFLKSKIPYIWIRRHAGSQLKTDNAERQIPLVGAALYAFRKRPEGFARYKTSEAASATINKYLTINGLRPTPEHSLYSLRHTFKDRLRDAGAPEEVIDNLMGHEGHRPRYGRGHNLETKYLWMKKIAFKVS